MAMLSMISEGAAGVFMSGEGSGCGEGLGRPPGPIVSITQRVPLELHSSPAAG